jgi:PadR family transcriptional regulator, regulatory protein PadR
VWLAATTAAAGTVSGRIDLVEKGGQKGDASEVVVYLEGSKTRPKPETATVTMKGKQFIPHVVVVPVGSTVSFPNEDPIFHNAFSVSGENRFDLDLYKRPSRVNVSKLERESYQDGPVRDRAFARERGASAITGFTSYLALQGSWWYSPVMKSINDDDWITQARRGLLEMCVLALIAEKPRYGYDLVSGLGRWEALTTTDGTLYPLLRRLLKDGHVAAKWQESAEGPPRKYYRLTPKGQSLLSRLGGEWEKLAESVTALLKMSQTERAKEKIDA